jgi:hypothetical protein
MRQVALWVAACLLCCPACQPAPQRVWKPGATPAPTASETAAPALGWLDAGAQLESARRLVTPDGTDLRQAVYVRPGGGDTAQILVRLRDYSGRVEGQCDPQRVELVDPGSDASQPVELEAGLLPVDCLRSADDRSYCITALRLPAGVSIADARLAGVVYASNAAPQTLELDRLYPLCIGDGGALGCRSVRNAQLANGLPVLDLDWDAVQLQAVTSSGRAPRGTNSALVWNGQAWAAYRIAYDPQQPAAATVDYRASSGGWSASLPCHLSYSPFAWLPPLLWGDQATLITIAFRPNATGISAQPNYDGLFRLVALDAGSGHATLIEDRLTPYLPVVAADGIVFYTLSQPDGERTRWELWAAGLDGLRKQRLLAVRDAVYLSVEDELDGRRLLVQHQYISSGDSGAVLHTELRELSLDALPGAVEEAPAAAESESQPGATDLFGGQPPATADGAGTAPEPPQNSPPDDFTPPPPSGGSSPPPIAVPE